MRISRRFTTAGRDPYEGVPFESRTSKIVNPDGSVVFEANDVEIPADWSTIAGDIMASKYMRKAGVPLADTVAIVSDPECVLLSVRIMARRQCCLFAGCV